MQPLSAVEGVQAQTRVLMRALRRLRIPTLIFVNKIDRRGAQCERVLEDISERLTPAAIAMGSVSGEGTRTAVCTTYADGDPAFTSRLVDLLAAHDDALLAAYVDDETSVRSRHPRGELAAQTKRELAVRLALRRGSEGSRPGHPGERLRHRRTRGEGVLESAFDHHQEVRGAVPARPRSDHNPLDRKEYLLRVARRRAAPVT